MSNTIASFLVTSAMAKGRGGGGGSGSGVSINDNWDAPGVVKAQMAFNLIFFIVGLVQLAYVLKNLPKIPSIAARAPYILLAVVILFTVALHLTSAIYIRIVEDLLRETAYQISLTMQFFYAVDTAFRPAVILYLIHNRAGLLLATLANKTHPLTSQIWKRILDWVLVGITFVFYIAYMGVNGTYYASLVNGTATNSQYRQYLNANRGLGHTLTAMVVLFAIDIIFSLITLFIHGKRAQAADLVVKRLLLVVAPVFALFAIATLAFDIYYSTNLITNMTYAIANLIGIIVEGFCQVAITAGIISTMTLSGVQWTAQQAGEPATHPGTPGQWSTPNSGWTQPLYNPQQQPYYPQQQPYYPQQQQQQPYSVPHANA
jgi:hypothetical protein